MASLSNCLKLTLFIIIIFHITLLHNSLVNISTQPKGIIVNKKDDTSDFSNINIILNQHTSQNTLQEAPITTTPPSNEKHKSSSVHSILPNDHNFADTRHMGELFTVRDKDVHSLAWTVDLCQDCNINEVIGKVGSETNDSFKNLLNDQKLRSCNKFPFELLLLKKVLPFGNTYLIAHTYFKFYRRLFQNSRRKFMRSIANNLLPEKISGFNKLENEIVSTNNNKGIENTIASVQKNSSHFSNSNLTATKTIEFHLPLEASLNSQTQESIPSLPSSHTTQSSAKKPISTYTSTPKSGSSVEYSHHQLPHSRVLLAQTVEQCISSYLQQHPCVLRHAQEVLHKRMHRGIVPSDHTSGNTENEHKRVKRAKPHFTDPLYKDQWHLHGSNTSTSSVTHHINVAGAWESGVTGQGVTVCVIDDGLEWNHTDIRDNYNKLASYDLNADDPDPSPARNGEANEHGTRCAGEIAGVANTVCGVGVAYRASVAGVRVLGGRMTDSMEALAFSYQIHHNDVYSCSWGPEDDGRTVEGPHALGRRALRWGTNYGRKGRGAVYVVASGNGGSVQDNCNFDGYANSIYTVTIGAVDSDGKLPYYAERCAAMLAVAPSSGHHGKDIVTTDWHESTPSGCTLHHTGTSAAAPLAAGVVALALQTQPCLGWRDVQHLMVITSRKIDEDNPEWFTNAAGLSHSHTHGFGLLDASGMVSAAAVWETLPFATKFVGPKAAPSNGGALGNGSSVFEVSVNQEQLDRFGLRTLETVEVRVWLSHEYRGSVGFMLVCPSGTNTTLATSRPLDKSSAGLSGWPLVSVRCWAEAPAGTYRLIVTRDPNMANQLLRGSLDHWQLVLHGNSAPLEEISRRIRQARAAVQGISVHISNRSSLCHHTPPQYPQVAPIPPNWLKILLLAGCIAGVSAVVSSLEYAFCYNSEKKKFQEAIEQMQRARQTFGGGGAGAARGRDHVALCSRPGLPDPRRSRGASASYAPTGARQALQHAVLMEGGGSDSQRPLLCTDGTSSQ